MFKPITLFIGLRYTRSKHRNRFVSFISLMSMFGIALGIIVLITVLSVVNGFDREIKKSVFSMVSPITVSSFLGPVENWEKLQQLMQSSPKVTAVGPFVTGQALLQNGSLNQPVIVSGIIPSGEGQVSAISQRMLKGNLADLKRGQYSIVLSQDLADRLDTSVGENIIIVTPQSDLSISNIIPHFQQLRVVGIYREIGGGFSAKMVYLNLYDAQKIFKLGSAVTGLHANITNIYLAPQISEELQNQLPSSVRVSNWTEQLGDFFENIRLTKTMMFFIFVLIIIVAAFNLICTLVMAVKSKQSDIAILRTMGATPTMIMTIFVIQGAAIGFGGTFLGLIGGIGLAWYITDIVNGLQQILHTQFISSNIYFVNYLPSELHWSDVWIICIVAFILSLIATLYPSWSASRIQPVEALRYD